MDYRISEWAKRFGVSVRTLRWYDEIGLLHPNRIDPATGYRYYADAQAPRMRQILYYRALDFPLETVARILDAPDYDRRAAIGKQRALLLLKKERLERLIDMLDEAEKGDFTMDKKPKDRYTAERDAFEAEAKARWGHTDAYRAYEKTDRAAREMGAEALERATNGFAAAAKAGKRPGDPDVQQLVKAWQDCISAHFYPCTKEILKGLGQMYCADDRFRSNLDAHGAGTAQLLSDAIALYCEQ